MSSPGSRGRTTSLARQRCFNHADREAAARCPACGRFFCRECVTDHEGKVLCAQCLRTTEGEPRERRTGRTLSRALQASISFLVLWFVFYTMGRALLTVPTQFHEDTMWQVEFMAEE